MMKARTTPLRFRNPCSISLLLLIVLSYLVLALLPDLRSSVPEWIGINAFIIILLFLVTYLNQRYPTNWSALFILVVAAVLRAFFLWRTPELSDDIFRYLFDGLMFLHGRNPYAVAPADLVTADPDLLKLIAQINHPFLPTIYPPGAQLVFAAGAGIGGLTGMKLCLVLLDLFSCFFIVRILDRLGLDRTNAILYAWHPLPVIEIAASGHIDAAAIFFMFSTIFFVVTPEARDYDETNVSEKNTKTHSLTSFQAAFGWLAGVLFSLAVLTKWLPLIFLPGILLMIPAASIKRIILGFTAGTAAMLILFWPEVKNSFNTLSVYVSDWEFSGFVFRWLRVAIGSGTIARTLITAGFAAAMSILYYRYYKTTRRRSRVKTMFKYYYAITIIFLLLTPTLHPWYALYLAAFLPFAAEPGGLILSWSVFLSYRVVMVYGITGQWIENEFTPFLIVIGPVLAWTAGVIIRRINPVTMASGR